MSVIQSIKDIFTDDPDAAVGQAYVCSECGHEFETAKNNEHRISCPECLANDVKRADQA